MTRRRWSVVLVTCFVLGLAATVCSAAGILALGGTKVLSPTQVEVTVTYQFAASEAQQANLRVRPLPLSLGAQFDISPRSTPVQAAGSPQQKTFVLTWKGTGNLAVEQIALALDAGTRPFSTQRVTVNWSFPLAAALAGGGTTSTTKSTTKPPTTTTTTLPPVRPSGSTLQRPLMLLPGPKAVPLDTKVDAAKANTVRNAMRGLHPSESVSTGGPVQDRGLYHTMMLNTAVSQPKATDQPLPLGEVISNYVPPVLGSPGTSEPTDTTKPTTGGRPSPDELPVVTDLKCRSISASQRGGYLINFSYHLNKADDRVPITFDCVFEGDAANWVSQVPWVHEAPAGGVTVNGAITLYIDALDAPLTLGKAPFTLRARGKKGHVLAEIKLTPKYDWLKSYAQMSKTTLVTYWNNPNSAHSVTRVEIYGGAGSDSLEERQKRYSEEPPMLVFKTAQGSYGRGLFKPCVGSQGLKGLWLVDLDCYLGAAPYWLEGHPPPDLDDYGSNYRSYDVGGLLLKDMKFDLDWGGFFCTDAEADLVVQTDVTGKTYYLTAVNGCEIKY